MLPTLPEFLISSPFQHTQQLLSGLFSQAKDAPNDTQVALFQEGLRLQFEGDMVHWFPFDFECKFTLMREQCFNPEKDKVGDPFGLKFERGPTQGALILHNSCKDTLIKWRNSLAQLINQRGFHDLYKPYRKIGKGNSATVYLAERLEDRLKIAIKAFAKQSVASQPRGKESLINEISIMRRFNHPTLMKLFEVFQTDNSYYLAIEHLDGGQLFQKVNNRRFNLRQIQQILKKLTEGLLEMHTQKIIHRDLKPQNLIFRSPNDYDDIVIADYGLATKTDQPEYIFVRCGTPGYVAPEIINFKGKTGQEPISDIFSLGIITHILATGRSPFSGKQYQEVLNQNRVSNFNFEFELYKYVDPVLLDLIKKMMKVDPKQRIRTEDILDHPFFSMDKSNEVVLNEEFTQAVLTHEKNPKKCMQKIIDEQGSFVIGKPQILKGNDEEYNSMSNVGSNQSVASSPQSIRVSSFVARKREHQVSSPTDNQFRLGLRKAPPPKMRLRIGDLKEPGKRDQPKQKQTAPENNKSQ